MDKTFAIAPRIPCDSYWLKELILNVRGVVSDRTGSVIVNGLKGELGSCLGCASALRFAVVIRTAISGSSFQ
jgi:hypothetical protein